MPWLLLVTMSVYRERGRGCWMSVKEIQRDQVLILDRYPLSQLMPE